LFLTHSAKQVDNQACRETVGSLFLTEFKSLARCETARQDNPHPWNYQPRHRSRRAPELVADRLITFAEIVGQENVIAGTDCGLGGRVHPQIAVGQAARPARRRGDREQEVVELNSKVPVRNERNKSKKVWKQK